MRRSRLHALLGCAAVGVAAACRSPTGPTTFPDPQATSAALASLDSMFTAPALASFASLSLSQNIVPAAPLQRAARILDATRLTGPGLSSPAEAVRRRAALRASALAPASPQGLIIPDSLYGSVFTWDSASARYARTAATGGPASGIRFILYAVSPPTGAVSFPLTPVGQTDLLDESVGQTQTLHIIVAGVGATSTYVDYTGSLAIGGGFTTAGLAGSLSNGLTGGARNTLTFSVNAGFTGATDTVHATYTLNNPAIAIVLDAKDVMVRPHTDSVTVTFTFTRPGEALSLAGLVLTTSGVLDTVALGFGVNGHAYASVLGNAASETFYDHNGLPIGDTAGQHDVLVALDDLRNAVICMLELTTALLNPATLR